MDLAGTPQLSRYAAPTDIPVEETGSVRLLSAEEVSGPEFVAAWEDLAANAAEPNPFFEPWFVLPSLAHVSEHQDIKVFARFQNGHLVGLLPIVRSQAYYGYPVPHISTWLHDNVFCGTPLVAKGQEGAFWRDLLDHVDRQPGPSLFLHLPQVADVGSVNAALNAELSADGRTAIEVESAERAMLASKLNSEEYYSQAMSTKKRKELRRQKNRLAEEGELTFERMRDAASLDTWISEFLLLEAAGWKGKGGSALSSSDQTHAFFTAALVGAAHAGKLERLALRLNGQPIAMLANLITPPGAFSFKTAFDEAYARFSPGLLLQIENLELLNQSDLEWTDSCAVEGHSMIERIWREKRRMVSRNIAIGGSLRRAAFRALMAYETRGRRGS